MLRSFLLRSAAFVYPCPCFACGRPLPPVQAHGACPACWAGLDPLGGPWCRSCGAGLDAGRQAPDPPAVCGPCALDPLPVGAACAAVVYDGVSRRFLLRGKRGGRPELLFHLGLQLAIAARQADLASDCDFVVPVPSHPLDRLRRGFDPATEVARGLSRDVGLPLRRGVLRRRWTRTRSIKALGAAARRRAAATAFRCRPLRHTPRVLLVDDVLTTGATSRAAVQALLAAGASEVRLAVWARTPRRPTAGLL